MSYTVTRAPRDPKTPIVPPVAEGGDEWRFGMFLPGFGRLAWADTAPDLVAAMLDDPKYTQRTEQEQLVGRILQALRLQVTTQAQINVRATQTGDWDDLCGWERAVLDGPRHVAPNLPNGFPTRALFGADLWCARVPLVCLTTASEPLCPGVPPILGNEEFLWVFDPVDDESLLDSLEEFGVVRTFVRDL